jgi:hypothetical protein
LERLNASESLTLVLAPAGYGKTTLLSMWLETCDVPNAWLSLDEHDNDLIVFANYLAEALHTLFPAVADDTFSAINGVTAPPPADHERVAQVSAPVLCSRCGAPMVKRIAKKGANAGKRFWGCSAFPQCREIRSAD